MNQGWQNLQISPLLDITILQGLAVLCLVAVIVFTIFRLRGTVWRGVVMVLVLPCPANISLRDLSREVGLRR